MAFDFDFNPCHKGPPVIELVIGSQVTQRNRPHSMMVPKLGDEVRVVHLVLDVFKE